MPRPNVAPRPVCRYYNTPRGCFAGDECHYLHGDPSVEKYAPYEEHKTCVYYAGGYCRRGHECWFRHADPEGAGGAEAAHRARSRAAADEEPPCGICFEERPALYGLLGGCSHAFCLTCIRQWRDPEGKGVDMQESGTHKTCPMCRVATRYIVPSSRFFAQDDARKAGVIEKYKRSMARVPCRYFARSKPGKKFCPFGRDCFYQHANPDGTRYEFAQGVDAMMPQWRDGRRDATAPRPDAMDHEPIEAVLQRLEDYARTLARGMGEPDDDYYLVAHRRATNWRYEVRAPPPEEEEEAGLAGHAFDVPLVATGGGGAARPRPISAPPAIARRHTAAPHESGGEASHMTRSAELARVVTSERRDGGVHGY